MKPGNIFVIETLEAILLDKSNYLVIDDWLDPLDKKSTTSNALVSIILEKAQVFNNHAKIKVPKDLFLLIKRRYLKIIKEKLGTNYITLIKEG